MNALCFWFPFVSRELSIRIIERKLQDAWSNVEGDEFIIIAHSFGTYSLIKVLERNPFIRPKRVLLCGAIVPEHYRWSALSQLAGMQLLNDCGAKDFWPAAASCLSWGYGASGTFGFGYPHRAVRDRHHDMGHSDYFNAAFIRKYWVPFVHDGDIVESEFDSNQPTAGYFINTLSWIKLGWLLVLVVIGLVGLSFYGIYQIAHMLHAFLT